MNVRELSAELSEKARVELGETPTRMENDCQILRTWISQQPHLNNNIRTDDQLLVTFLRGCKYSIERAKKKIETFYTIRSTCPELFSDLDPLSPNLQLMIKSGVYLPLPKTVSPDGSRILITRAGIVDPNVVSFEDYFKYNQILTLCGLKEDDQAIIAGVDYIIDVKDVSADIYQHMKIPNIKKTVLMNEDAIPLRYKSIHYINTPASAETFFNLIRKFIPAKARNRIFVHHDTEGLYEHFPKSILPIEYGGDEYTVQFVIDSLKEKLESYRDYFLDDMKYKSDESKRPGKPTTAETLFGLDGSFKQLEVD